MKRLTVQSLVTSIAIVLLVSHLIWPQLKIDSISLGLLFLAIIPWLTPLFKSLELPGGMKIEYQDLEEVREKIEDAGLISNTIPPLHSDFMPQTNQDPNLALAWLRIEIEKRVREISNKVGVDSNSSLRRMLDSLARQGILDQKEFAAIADITTILNQAIHGRAIDTSAASWALEVGPPLLLSLERRAQLKESHNKRK